MTGDMSRTVCSLVPTSRVAIQVPFQIMDGGEL